jgi:glycosyltransferase involved in cell wall biosynthesis
MLISVVTVCLNSKETLARTIDSVLKQTYKNIDYIVVDGLSDDGTVQLLETYQGRLRYFSQRDNGIYDAMNRGLFLSRGEYVTFLNADDFYTDEFFIESIVFEIKRSGLAEIYCSNIFYGDSDNFILLKSTFRGLRTNMTLNHPGSFIKRDVHLANLFDMNYQIAADYELFLRLISKGAAVVICNINGCFMSKGGASSRFARTTRELFYIQKKYFGPSHALYVYLRRHIIRHLKKIIFKKV